MSPAQRVQPAGERQGHAAQRERRQRERERRERELADPYVDLGDDVDEPDDDERPHVDISA